MEREGDEGQYDRRKEDYERKGINRKKRKKRK